MQIEVVRSWVIGLTAVAGGKCGQATSKNHEQAADDDSNPSSPGIGYVGCDKETDDGADAEHVYQDSEKIGIGVFRVKTEIWIPSVHLLRSVDKHAINCLTHDRCNSDMGKQTHRSRS